MKLELTPEQRAARAEFRAFAQAEIAPFADQWDREEAIPRELIDKLGRARLAGRPSCRPSTAAPGWT